MSVNVKRLLPELDNHPLAEVLLTSICEDSRQVQAGALYLAREGVSKTGLNYLAQALAKQPALVMLDRAEFERWQTTDIGLQTLADYPHAPLLSVEHLEEQRGHIAARFFGRPADSLTLIGITGTNGKTSCASFIAQSLELLGHSVAVIGTLGNGQLGQLTEATNTTPGPIELHALLAQFVLQGVTHVVMEVSSHALDQGRVNSVLFDVAGFTNLTRDHLDYHKTLEAYGEAKAMLFTPERAVAAVINCDSAFGADLFERVTLPKLAVAQSASSTGVSLRVRDNKGVLGSACVLSVGDESASLTTRLLGDFTLENLALTAGVLALLRCDTPAIADALSQVESVSGRMERIDLPNGAVAVVDYAHTPDALEQLLRSVRQLTSRQLICVFGCGGDRDVGKRPLMGAIADELADVCIVTNDNPRNEAADVIIDMVLAGMKSGSSSRLVLPERQTAIEKALELSDQGDLVVIAGKGHEEYQEVMGTRSFFSDQKVVADWIERSAL